MTLKFKGKDVQDAIAKGLKALNKSQEDVDIKIIRDSSFFGLVKAVVAITVEEKTKNQPEKKPNNNKNQKNNIKENTKQNPVVNKPVKQEKPAPQPVVKEDKKEESAETDEKVIEPRKIDSPEVEAEIIKYLKGMFETIELDNIEIEVVDKNGMKHYLLKGEDSEMLVGYKGEGLASIQTIITTYINQKFKCGGKVFIDAENYKEIKENSIKLLARRMARKVLKTGKSQKLEPMNSYERRIVHLELQYNKKLTTESIGEEPNRCIVIKLK